MHSYVLVTLLTQIYSARRNARGFPRPAQLSKSTDAAKKEEGEHTLVVTSHCWPVMADAGSERPTACEVLTGILAAAQLEHLLVAGNALHGMTIGECAVRLGDDRPGFLAWIKSAGVDKVGTRQRVANAVGRWARERECAGPPSAPAAAPAAALASPYPDNDALPVVYVHVGARPYVEAAVRVTASYHRGPIFILGDATVGAMVQASGLHSRVTFVNVCELRDETVERARRCYVHRSSNDAAFEFFCFERVLILGRFLAARGLPRAVHLDSDCVLRLIASDCGRLHACRCISTRTACCSRRSPATPSSATPSGSSTTTSTKSTASLRCRAPPSTPPCSTAASAPHSSAFTLKSSRRTRRGSPPSCA